MISSISSFEIISVVIPDPKNYFWTPAFVTDGGTVNLNGIKINLSNSLSTFFLKGKPVFNNDPRNLPKNLPDCLILDNLVFDSFILADELFPKTLGSLKFCALVNNNLCAKLTLSLELPIIFDGRFKIL